MQKQEMKVIYYTREYGGVPMDDFMCRLNSDDREKIETEIAKIRLDRNYLIKHSKSLENCDGLFEFRIRCKQLAIRLMYYYGRNHDIIITHGIIKRTKHTPENEKRVAEKYFRDWCLRGN